MRLQIMKTKIKQEEKDELGNKANIYIKETKEEED